MWLLSGHGLITSTMYIKNRGVIVQISRKDILETHPLNDVTRLYSTQSPIKELLATLLSGSKGNALCCWYLVWSGRQDATIDTLDNIFSVYALFIRRDASSPFTSAVAGYFLSIIILLLFRNT